MTQDSTATNPIQNLAKGEKLQSKNFTEQVKPRHNWREAQINDCIFLGAVLLHNNFTSCRISKSNFYYTDLKGSQFQNAEIENTQMVRAILRGCDFQNASLVGVNLKGACLCGATFTGSHAELANVQLEDICYNDDTVWPNGFEPPPSRAGGCHCDESEAQPTIQRKRRRNRAKGRRTTTN